MFRFIMMYSTYFSAAVGHASTTAVDNKSDSYFLKYCREIGIYSLEVML